MVKGYTAKVGLRKPVGGWVEASRLWYDLDSDDAALEALAERMAAKRALHPCPDMSCPHCPCTYTAECCHCGDGQVHK